MATVTTTLDAETQFQQHLLQGVARTFALTIPQLKPRFARIVANAYLLCRITDTIEDESGISIEQKRRLTRQFIDVVAGRESAQHFVDAFYPLLSEQRLPAERELIQNTPRVIQITRRFMSEQQAILEKCVAIMGEGMAYYQARSSIDGLPDIETFNNYCYHVAGVVGEMLTELACEQNEAMKANRLQLRVLALSFGQGLQMVNILKDIWEDRARGVCWLPRDIFGQAGYDLSDLREDNLTEDYKSGIKTLVAIAHAHLHNALRYILLIPKKEQGLRKFCLWALGMALLTLHNIYRHPGFTAGSQVKISRKSVMTVVIAGKLMARSNHLSRAIVGLLGLGLPHSREVSTSNSHEQVREWFNA